MNIIFTNQQEQVIKDAVRWFHSSSKQLFEIEGEAGTGKSVVLFEIIRRLHLKPDQYLAMAYTGQAAIVMRTKGFPNARSIHSTLYNIEKVPIISDYDTKNDKDPLVININTEFNTKNFRYEFIPLSKGELPDSVKLLVIDEAYMVPKSMKKDIIQHGIKVLVAGDSGQLPPIAQPSAFLDGYNTHVLTELMRQAKNDPIIYLARRARRGLPIHTGVYGDRALVIEDTDLTNEMVLNVGNVICGTNKTRDMFNSTIRALQGKLENIPVRGDRVICRANNWDISQCNIALANGLTGTIVSDVTVDKFFNKDRTLFYMDFLPDILPVPFKNLEVHYPHLTSLFEERNKIRQDRYARGEFFEFAYAITTHLSQGAEYRYGIYYEEFLRPSIQNQLIYTGITRFKEAIIYVKKSRKIF